MFWSLLSCCHLRSLPGVGDFPRCPATETTRKAEDFCSYPRGLTQTWVFSPKTPWRKGGGTAGGSGSAPRKRSAPVGGHTHFFGRDIPPAFLFPSGTWAGGRRQRPGGLDTPTGIWGGGTPPQRALTLGTFKDHFNSDKWDFHTHPQYKRLHLGYFSPITFL